MKKKKRHVLCIIGFHKLVYVTRYRITSKLKCNREGCNAEYLDGGAGELYRQY